MPSLAITVAALLIVQRDVLAITVQTRGGRRTSASEVPEASPRHCSSDEQRRAALALRANITPEIRANPCLSDLADRYAQGLEDPADAVEFLGQPAFTEVFAEEGCRTHLLPKVLYLGMERAGSTTFAELLNRHPHLSYGFTKEHRYWTKFGEKSFALNNDEYLDSFRVQCDVVKSFDATPNLYGLPLVDPLKACHVAAGPAGLGSGGMQALVETLGNDTQLLVMVRDPVKVITSLNRPRSFEHNSQKAVKFCDCFVDGISGWMEYFPREQFHFITSEEFFEHPQDTMQGVLDFLDVGDYHYGRRIPEFGRRRAAAKAPNKEQLQTYREKIAPCQKKLATLTGLTLNWAAEA